METSEERLVELYRAEIKRMRKDRFVWRFGTHWVRSEDINIDRHDAQVITDIVRRAVKDRVLARSAEFTLFFDIQAVHAAIYALDLQQLLASIPEDFRHDIHGIRKHLNRSNLTLEQAFVPKCARN